MWYVVLTPFSLESLDFDNSWNLKDYVPEIQGELFIAFYIVSDKKNNFDIFRQNLGFWNSEEHSFILDKFSVDSFKSF